MDRLYGWVARLLKVPPEPTPPYGGEGSTLVFKPARRYFRLRVLRWAFVQGGTAIGLFFAFGWSSIPAAEAVADKVHFGPFSLGGFLSSAFFHWIEIFGVGVYLLQIPLSYAMVHLDYRMRWYLVTDRSLRIREGLKTVRERTMTFANVQNLSIRQNPIQRLFGIADLQVRSAGGGSSGEEHVSDDDEKSAKNLHVAVFRGISNADEIRDLVLARLKVLRTAGIGDPDDESSAPATLPNEASPALTSAMAELRTEAQRLRAAAHQLDAESERLFSPQ